MYAHVVVRQCRLVCLIRLCTLQATGTVLPVAPPTLLGEAFASSVVNPSKLYTDGPGAQGTMHVMWWLYRGCLAMPLTYPSLAYRGGREPHLTHFDGRSHCFHMHLLMQNWGWLIWGQLINDNIRQERRQSI